MTRTTWSRRKENAYNLVTVLFTLPEKTTWNPPFILRPGHKAALSFSPLTIMPHHGVFLCGKYSKWVSWPLMYSSIIVIRNQEIKKETTQPCAKYEVITEQYDKSE